MPLSMPQNIDKNIIINKNPLFELAQQKLDFETRWQLSKNSSETKKNPYETIRTIGTGSFGRVALCRNDDGEFFAMKVMRMKMIAKNKQAQHTLNEKENLYAIDKG
jgi:serine/threonine protein kinase